jgi:HCOMODA/2-hydroxy-3-carboxy-muconic semialdehyde decarboxylase
MTAAVSVAGELSLANRILYQQGVVDAFGHVSQRSPSDPGRFFIARSLAPALVTADDILELDLDTQVLGPRSAQASVECFIHAEIYRHRSDVQAIVHSHSPAVIPWGVTSAELRPIFHMSGFLGRGVPVFDIAEFGGPTNMLISSAELGAALAHTLALSPVALMRGHGSVAVGASLHQAVFRAVYLEVNARLQLDATRLGTIRFLDREEAALAEATSDSAVDRAWELWAWAATRQA